MQLQEYQSMIEKVGEGLGPNDDWLPMLFMEKDRSVNIVGMPMIDTEAGKDKCAAMIFATIAMCNPDSVAWLTTAWGVFNPPSQFTNKEEFMEAYKKGYITRPRDSSNRIEIVSVVCIGSRGENEGEGFMTGYIERFPDKAPRISKWDVHDDPDIEMAGRFPNAIKMGFKYADPKGNLDMLRKMVEEKQKYERGDNTNRNR